VRGEFRVFLLPLSAILSLNHLHPDMAPTDEIAYLKGLARQLQEKIEKLEKEAAKKIAPTPAQQLRMILIGPPGAGACDTYFRER
jgi:hypothetical protein